MGIFKDTKHGNLNSYILDITVSERESEHKHLLIEAKELFKADKL